MNIGSQNMATFQLTGEISLRLDSMPQDKFDSTQFLEFFNQCVIYIRLLPATVVQTKIRHCM